MYTKKFNPSHYEPIADLLESIRNLEEGESLWVDDLSKEKVHNIRWLLYNWFHHQDLKKSYRMRVLEGDLRITRLSPRKEEKMGHRLRVFFERRLLHLPNEDEVFEILKQKEKLFSFEERMDLIDEWKRIQG